MLAELYLHNEESYQKAICMMQEHRSVAVVHPTSTGKSFIAFKLAEEHPGQRSGWLAPASASFAPRRAI